MKTTIATIATSILALNAFSNGLYFVSGGDFRDCNIRYVMETTQPNEDVTITPSMVTLLTLYGNPQWAGPWSVKTDGNEYTYGEKDFINTNLSSEQMGKGCTNKEPTTVTYSNPGLHLVKMYNLKGNAYMLNFSNNPNLKEIKITWEDTPATIKFANDVSIGLNACSKLKNAYIGYPRSSGGKQLSGFNNFPELDDLTINNIERFSTTSSSCFQNNMMTNDLRLGTITSIGNYSFSCPRVEFVDLSSCQTIGKSCFNMAGQPITSRNWGLKRLRISNKFTSTSENTFWNQLNLKTIEFVSESDNWIEEWNNNEMLTILFGTASQADGQLENEATLTPWPAEEVPSTLYAQKNINSRPTPNKLVFIRSVTNSD